MYCTSWRNETKAVLRVISQALILSQHVKLYILELRKEHVCKYKAMTMGVFHQTFAAKSLCRYKIEL